MLTCWTSSWMRRLQVAGYCMYGSATELVITFYGSGVHRFTLDPSLGEFIHIKADIKIPSKPKASEVGELVALGPLRVA